MKVKSKIIIAGDVHTYWSAFNRLLKIENPDIVLQCGDFGYWPNLFPFDVERHNSTIYFCDGNHEDHWSLRNLKDNEIRPNVFYMKRGSMLKLPDGRNVLFMGGANSVDEPTRTIGINWFPEEIITNREIYELPDEKIDIVISHTCPNEFFNSFVKKLRFTGYDDNDPSRKALSYILENYRPKLWYFAHFHLAATGMTKDCKWFALNKCALKGWWKTLLKG